MTRRDMNGLIEEACALGFEVTRSSRHWRLRLPGGATLFAPTTPSDWRSVHNMRAQIKRALRDRDRNAIVKT